MRSFPLNALLATLLFCGAVSAQQPTPPADAASVPVRPTVRQEVAKLLSEARTLQNERKWAQVKEKLEAAGAVADRTPYENYFIARIALSSAIEQDDAAGAAQSVGQVLQLNDVGQWIGHDEVLSLIQAVGTVHYRVKDYAQAAQWMERNLKAGGTDPVVKKIRLQAYLFSENYLKAAELAEDEITQSQKAGRVPAKSDLEILAQARNRLKDHAGEVRVMDLLVKYYPKKDYWQFLINDLWNRQDLATRLQLDVFRLALQVGTLQETTDYTEYVDLAQRAGYSVEALKVFDQGAARGLLDTGQNADNHKKLRLKLELEAAQDRKTLEIDTATALKKSDGRALINLGMNMVAMDQFDKGLELMEKGIVKGVSKYGQDAKLHLAMAYAQSGQTDKALQTFATVSGKDGLDELARYWALALRKP